MRDSGRRIKLVEKENFGMLMVIYLMGNGKMIRLTDMELTFM